VRGVVGVAGIDDDDPGTALQQNVRRRETGEA
jgi:hypothetical protein